VSIVGAGAGERPEPAGLRGGVEPQIQRDQPPVLGVEPREQRAQIGGVGRQIVQADEHEHLRTVLGQLLERPYERGPHVAAFGIDVVQEMREVQVMLLAARADRGALTVELFVAHRGGADVPQRSRPRPPGHIAVDRHDTCHSVTCHANAYQWCTSGINRPYATVAVARANCQRAVSCGDALCRRPDHDGPSVGPRDTQMSVV